jgi:hypothetical protein
MSSTAEITKGEGNADVVTPSGLKIHFESKPRRHYVITRPADDGGEYAPIEAVSVTTALDVLYKGGLDWWGQRIGTAGMLSLFEMGVLAPTKTETGQTLAVLDGDGVWQFATQETMDDALKRHGLNVMQATDKASARGSNVHDALEVWAATGTVPVPETYPETERGYVTGLVSFLRDTMMAPDGHEILVGSYDHGFAGRFDLQVKNEVERKVVTKIYPKAQPKHALLPLGKGRIDLKTSKDIYYNNFLQLAGYEGACIESGYGPSDWRAILRVSADGRYELRQSKEVHFEDFLKVLDLYWLVKRCEQAVKP